MEHIVGSLILIIDDDELSRSSLRTVLSQAGARVMTASSSRHGLKMAAGRMPDLILCGLNPFAREVANVFARLRGQSGMSDIPVIFLVGHADLVTARQCLCLGTDSFLSKPVDHEDLLRATSASLKQRKLNANGSKHHLAIDPRPISAPNGKSSLAASREQGNLEGQKVNGGQVHISTPVSMTEVSTPLTILLVEPDNAARQVLQELFATLPQAEVLGAARTLAEARRLLTLREPEAVFFADRLPDGSGFDLLPALRPHTQAVCIADTAEFAVRAFEGGVVDYLIKPFRSERVRKSWNRLLQRRINPTAPVGTGGAEQGSGVFMVKTSSERRLINMQDIRRIMAFGEYSLVYWDDEKYTLVRKPLKVWTRELAPDKFVRIHRRAVVNLTYIERVSRRPNGQMQIHLRGTSEPISISIRLAPVFNQKLKELCEQERIRS